MRACHFHMCRSVSLNTSQYSDKMSSLVKNSIRTEKRTTRLQSQNTEKSKNRTKNYTLEESRAIIRCCLKYHEIIDKNSKTDKDKSAKVSTWKQIKRDFDVYCKSNGIFVSSINFFT